MKPKRLPEDPVTPSGEYELHGTWIACHEIAHFLGAGDLEDKDNMYSVESAYTPNDDNDHPVNDWCLMGYYGYGFVSLGAMHPSHLCGYYKHRLGWIEPMVLGGGEYENLVLYDIETHADSVLYRLNLKEDGSEYFLLEYRNPRSTAKFDKFDSDFSVMFFPKLALGADSLERGLLIMHVDDSIPTNSGMPNYLHYRVHVEDAGYNPAMDTSANPGGQVAEGAQWWYPYETQLGALFSNETAGQSVFSGSTTPSSDSYTGPSGVVVRVDSIVGERLYLYVNHPASYDADADGVTDGSDNCPSVPNPEQLDIDADGLGDLCDDCWDVDNDTYGDPKNPLHACGEDCDDNDGSVHPLAPEIPADGIDQNCDGFDPCCTRRGDVNNNGAVNVADLTYLVNFLFKGGPAAPCLEEANLNSIPPVNVGDLTFLVNHLFKGGPAPGAC